MLVNMERRFPLMLEIGKKCRQFYVFLHNMMLLFSGIGISLNKSIVLEYL